MARRLTHEEFSKRVMELEEGRYALLDKYKYKNNRTKVLMRHNVCGFEYMVTPSGFVGGNRCPSCCYKKRGAKHKTTKKFKEELFTMFRGGVRTNRRVHRGKRRYNPKTCGVR